MTRPQKFAVAGAVAAGLILAVVAGVHYFTSTPQPPIKVRGGAMTLRYPPINNTDPWYPYPPGGPKAFCTTLDTTSGTAKLKIFQHPDPDPEDTSADAQKFTLTGSWIVDLYARNSDFSTDPKEGIELKPVSDCDGSNKGVALYPVQSATNSGFYSADLQPIPGITGPGNTYGKRYQKSGCTDEDACEHLSTIYVNIPPAQPQSVDCQNGDCLVKIMVR
jgi:hypothetical protein